MENLFIQALVRAGTCAEHQKPIPWRLPTPFSSAHHKSRRKGHLGSKEQSRHFHSRKAWRRPQPAVKPEPPSQEELKDLVDFYGNYETPEKRVPSKVEESPPKPQPGMDVLSSGEQNQTQEKEAPYAILPLENEHDERIVSDMEDLLSDDESSDDEIYNLYRNLTFPRICYLPYDVARAFIHRLSVVEHKTEASMVRFLSILDDKKAAGIPILVDEWSTGIYFAGRCLARPTTAEVENALYIWKELEGTAGIKSNEVTFNILFDIATKAGKFVLAGMIYKEMQNRKLRFDRFFRTSWIFYHGCKGDANGVRQAYRELVEAGEIVDTAVLNCVISSLLRCHETAAAEQVFERMKQMHAQKAGGTLPPRTWRDARQLGRVLDKAAKSMREDPGARAKVQDIAPVAPDSDTFKVLIRYHAQVSGDFNRILELLNELDFYDLPRTNPIYMYLFSGFSIHHAPYSPWSVEQLERILKTLLKQADASDLEDGSRFRWEAKLVEWVVDAFGKLTGQERALQVWEEIRRRWEPGKVDEDKVVDRLRRAVPGARTTRNPFSHSWL